MPSITAEHDGQTFPIDLSLVSALDAVVYRKATGENLDARLGAMIGSAPDAPADWPLADKGVLAWLFVRQAVNPDALLAEVLSTITLFPADTPAAEAGATDAPGDN